MGSRRRRKIAGGADRAGYRWVSRPQPSRPQPGELVVTLDTVKKHVSHLLGKLGAANRTEAVTRARELSLIP
jgi:LuxR family transcriptional regulator, maltose regulon positive regulatory protein